MVNKNKTTSLQLFTLSQLQSPKAQSVT